MRTPAGTECRYYYADYYRGSSKEECRLLARVTHARVPHAERWEPKLCAHCPVPGILRANACPHMRLYGRVVRRWLGLQRRVEVRAACAEDGGPVANPHVGCGHCHPQGLELLQGEPPAGPDQPAGG